MFWVLVLALWLCISEDSQALGHCSILFIWRYRSTSFTFFPLPPPNSSCFKCCCRHSLSEYSLHSCQPSTQLLLLWIYSSSTLAGEILSLPGCTHHSHLHSHIFLGLHSLPCWSAVSYQYNLTVNEKEPYSSRAKKREKNLIANFHLLPKTDNCVVSFPYPALPFLPLWLTPHSQ